MPCCQELMMQVTVGREVAVGARPNQKIVVPPPSEPQKQCCTTGLKHIHLFSRPTLLRQGKTKDGVGFLIFSPDIYVANYYKIISETILNYLSLKHTWQPSNSSVFLPHPVVQLQFPGALYEWSIYNHTLSLKRISPTFPCSTV